MARLKARRAKSFMPTEHAIQAGFVSGCRVFEKQWPELALGFAVPNGGLRNRATAGKLRAEGVRPGVPDWMLPVARRGYNGMAIEFKRPDGSLSEAQAEYIPKLIAAGWYVRIHTDCGDALADVLLYLNG